MSTRCGGKLPCRSGLCTMVRTCASIAHTNWMVAVPWPCACHIQCECSIQHNAVLTAFSDSVCVCACEWNCRKKSNEHMLSKQHFLLIYQPLNSYKSLNWKLKKKKRIKKKNCQISGHIGAPWLSFHRDCGNNLQSAQGNRLHWVPPMKVHFRICRTINRICVYIVAF